MARNFISDGVYLAKVMRDHLNKWPNKPTTVLLEDLEKKYPSMMLQQLAAAEKKRTYVNGSYVAGWSFAVYVRINAEDTASRLDALACLDALYEWLKVRDSNGAYVNLPEIDINRVATGITMSTTPSIAARYDDGTEDYQAVFELEYKYSVRR